ncbi:MAG: TonB-dependent receptor [Kofleriaceae bacterium]
MVVERGSPTPISGASVLADRGAIAVTDVDGYFAIEVERSDRVLTVVASGYITRQIRIGAGEDVLRIELQRSSSSEVIEVVDRAPEQTKPLSYQLTADEIRAIPGAGNDILRAAQALPGVARIPFSFGGLVLRGTSPRDTAVYLDGIEVPLSFHFGGVTSFYPSGMLSDLTLTAGGFDASHGRAQGGLVTLTTREPRTDRFRFGGSFGLFDSSVQAEGPLWGGGGFLVGLRRSYFDTIAGPFVDSEIPLPSYWDFQIRTTYGDPRRWGRITPMVFSSIDRVASDQVSLTSMFLRVAAPYFKQWGPLALRIVPWVGTNQLTFIEKDDPLSSDDREQSFARPVYPGGLRSELLRDFGWGHLRGGLELQSGYLAQSQVGVSGENVVPMTSNGHTTIAWSDLAGWIEARWKIDGDRFAIKPGLRVEAYGLTGELVIDPRLNLHQRLAEGLTLRQAIGRYHQPPTPGDVDPRDGNPELDASYIDQVSLGVDAELPGDLLSSVTGFFGYGEQLGVRVRRPGVGSPLPEPDLGGLGPTFELLLEKQLGFAVYRENRGRARSYGVEVALKRRVGRWFSMLSYTLQKAERTDDPRRGGGWRPFELDQRHNLQLATSVQLGMWRFGARIQVVSGNPYSPTRYEVVDGLPLEVTEPWGGTLPPFFSLDLRADRRWHRSWGDVVLYVDIQNATNRRNVEGRQFVYGEPLPMDVDTVGLPVIPFIGVEFQPVN